MQWLLLTPQETGSKPIRVAIMRISSPITPVNMKTSVAIISMVIETNVE